MEREWINIKEIGQLYLEKILVSLNIPILFVCHNSEDKKYLCLNINDETGETIIALTNNSFLIDMLQKRITMEEIFRKSLDNDIIIAVYDYENEEIISKREKAEILSKDKLPKKGEYFDFCSKEIDEYLSCLKI